jgi:decaprenyl-phosphate phosphoribosyltransferase
MTSLTKPVVGETAAAPRSSALPMLLGMVRLMRPKHYLKNVLIFLPLVFGHQLRDLDTVKQTLIGFVAFAAVASAVYIVNDLRDVELDRQHPVKRNRPIASGIVPIPVAIAQVAVLLPLAGVLSWLAGSTVVGYAILGGYLLINLAYSFGLKNVPILDVSILAIGFIVRVYYGADIADIVVSEWFYLTMFSFSFFVSFGKRRNEILQTGTTTRVVNALYIPAFLDKAMYFSAAVAVVFYALWTIDSGQAHGLLIWTVPLVLVIFLVYILRVEQPDQSGDPIDVVVGSPSLLSLVAVYAAVVVGLLYGVA